MSGVTRRQALQGLAVAGAGMVLRLDVGADGQAITIGGRQVTTRLASLSPNTIRITVTPAAGRPNVNWDGALAAFDQRDRTVTSGSIVRLGGLNITPSASPLTFHVADAQGAAIQDLKIDTDSGAVHFAIGEAPILGFGEGGAQFDRRGVVDQMRNGQSGYQLRTHGGRVPIQWLIGTSGWALFFHQPFGTFDLKGPTGTLTPSQTDERALPLDCFVVVSKDPAVIMRE
ncbi:MAG TPA: twin-arginine translocation signal domain-containing protein [Vicinamibacterales bacterium]|nr:twin-arginine translocation signal domain-containing protein [Vicinamibacterales bacterium]